jgi:hypothetical protein
MIGRICAIATGTHPFNQRVWLGSKHKRQVNIRWMTIPAAPVDVQKAELKYTCWSLFLLRNDFSDYDNDDGLLFELAWRR